VGAQSKTPDRDGCSWPRLELVDNSVDVVFRLDFTCWLWYIPWFDEVGDRW
jgi:hypothetical protein